MTRHRAVVVFGDEDDHRRAYVRSIRLPARSVPAPAVSPELRRARDAVRAPGEPGTGAAGGTTALPFVLEPGLTRPGPPVRPAGRAVVGDARIHLARRPFWVTAG